MSAAQATVATQAQQGRPGGGGQGNNSPGSNKPNTSTRPPAPTAAPKASDIHHSDASREHILDGDGGRQGGHRAGTGYSKKTEFPKDWDDPQILDAAHRVTQQGPPAKGPYLTKDADGNWAWAYDYEGQVDGVRVKTTVLANGEIRTAYPPYGSDPGVITNPSAPNPAPKGVPMGNPPRYSHPDVGGDGSWTWEGPKGNKIIRVVQDAQGNVTTTVLGDYKK
ncbi:EndoU domain-containing protein [Micromonospora sp. NPDC005806]|uniref:EndoU domain-containing protein n=1 Tax=Micromonospora sp. NPDC005806 TaxID=3364234 RepID=UPI0036772E37